MFVSPRRTCFTFVLFIVSFIFFPHPFLWAQTGGLSGQVKDSSGAPVAGAAVGLTSRSGQTKLQTVTGADGSYSFPAVTEGEYLVNVAAANFRAAVQNVSFKETATCNFELSISGVSEEIVVTATGTPLTTVEHARALTVLDRQEIDQRNESSLADTLRTVPGLRVNQRGGPGAFTTLRFRGLRTADTSILIDGLRIRDASGFRGDFNSSVSDFFVNNVDRIEVLRGSAGPLYGTAATGGVINVVSQTGAGGVHGNASFEGGTLAQFRERFTVAGGLKEKLSYSLGFSRTDVNQGVDGHDVFRNTAVTTRLAYNFTPDISISGNFSSSDTPRLDTNSSPIPLGPTGNPFGYESGKGPVTTFLSDLDDPDARRTSSFLAGWAAFKQRVNSIWSYSVSYQGTSAKRNFRNGPRQNPVLDGLGLFDFPFETSRFDGLDNVIETRHAFQLGRNNLLTAGLEHERESFTQEFASAAFGIVGAPTTDRQNSTAFFLNDQASFLDRRLQFGVGFRAQYFNVDNPQSVPELKGLKTPSAYTGDGSVSYYFARSQTKIRAHVGNSFRAPSLSERFSSIVTQNGPLRIGNPQIRPERALSVDGGIDQTLAGGKVRLSGTYFYTRLQEVIVSTAFLKEVNARGGLARGAEFEAVASPCRGLDFRLGYTYTRSDFIPTAATLRSDTTIAPANVSRRQQGIPDHQVSVGVNYAVSRWNFNFDFTGISNYDEVVFSPNTFTPVLFTFTGYKKADIGASYTLPLSDRMSLRFYTKVDNVFHQRYFEDGFRTPRAVGLGGVKLQF
ncbi:MAG: TonB-dependent receptor plug domain-containing protein [Blastocatellia bacterium]|nr:TonB-dependent receptor plug domain-containing protein [Blastocatellia bacterium]